MNVLILQELQPHIHKVGVIFIILFLLWGLYKLMTISPPLTFFVVTTVVLVYSLYHYFLKDIIDETGVFEPKVNILIKQEDNDT